MTIQRQINQLRRERADLASALLVHALADEDPEAMEIYGMLVAMDSEIYSLEQMKQDLFLSNYLAEQGAAAVAWVEAFLDCDEK